jgi:hypothetical protein
MALPIALVWVELQSCNACIDMQLQMLQYSIDNATHNSEALTLAHAGYAPRTAALDILTEKALLCDSVVRAMRVCLRVTG